MARTPNVDESKLTKMQLRKLNALRKSVGESIGTKAFQEWYASRPGDAGGPADAAAQVIADAVMELIEAGKIRPLPRGGYLIKRGHGRVVVSPKG